MKVEVTKIGLDQYNKRPPKWARNLLKINSMGSGPILAVMQMYPFGEESKKVIEFIVMCVFLVISLIATFSGTTIEDVETD